MGKVSLEPNSMLTFQKRLLGIFTVNAAHPARSDCARKRQDQRNALLRIARALAPTDCFSAFPHFIVDLRHESLGATFCKLRVQRMARDGVTQSDGRCHPLETVSIC